MEQSQDIRMLLTKQIHIIEAGVPLELEEIFGFNVGWGDVYEAGCPEISWRN